MSNPVSPVNLSETVLSARSRAPQLHSSTDPELHSLISIKYGGREGGGHQLLFSGSLAPHIGEEYGTPATIFIQYSHNIQYLGNNCNYANIWSDTGRCGIHFKLATLVKLAALEYWEEKIES